MRFFEIKNEDGLSDDFYSVVSFINIDNVTDIHLFDNEDRWSIKIFSSSGRSSFDFKTRESAEKVINEIIAAAHKGIN